MLYEKFLRKIYFLEDLIFEKTIGLSFSGNINAVDLKTQYETKLHAFEYRPVYVATLRLLFREAMKLNLKYHNFIDIGSGKGKACFFALKKKLFNKVIGVEFSSELVEIANANKCIYGSEEIEFFNSDASTYILPNGTSLVFLFNPFDEIVLRKFIQNNIEHFKTDKSIIAYANDIHRETILTMGFQTFFRDPMRMISIYTWP